VKIYIYREGASTVIVEQDVDWFDVSVYDIVGLQVEEGEGDLTRKEKYTKISDRKKHTR
jgi:hypothetical protein